MLALYELDMVNPLAEFAAVVGAVVSPILLEQWLERRC